MDSRLPAALRAGHLSYYFGGLKMRTLLFALAVTLAALCIASCNSKNPIGAEEGTIAGSITVDGPINGAAELLVGLFRGSSDTLVESATVGHVTSTATATLSGRAIAFSFTDVDFGTYNVRLYSTSAGNNTYYFTSELITISASAPHVTN